MKLKLLKTVVVIPKTMIAGDANALAGVVYQACLRQTGVADPGSAHLAGERLLVTNVLKDHVPLVEPGLDIHTGSAGDGLNTNHAPGSGKPVIIEAVTDTGIRVTTPDGKEQVHKYSELIKLHIDDCKKELEKEKAKGAHANRSRILDLQATLERSQKTYDILNNARHDKHKIVTQQLKSSFEKAMESANHLADPKAHGGTSSRSRLVFLSQLVRLALLP